MQRGNAPVLVWRRGDALLAVEVDAVVEVAPIDAPDGPKVESRDGPAPLIGLPGLRGAPLPRQAVVVRTGHGVVALPADLVEGIRDVDPERLAPPPPWLHAIAPAHLRSIVVLDDDRLAALLVLDSLRPGT